MKRTQIIECLLEERSFAFFATLSKRQLKRGVFRSVVDLQAAINRFLDGHNAQSKPFQWVADPDKIIAAVRRGHLTFDSIHSQRSRRARRGGATAGPPFVGQAERGLPICGQTAATRDALRSWRLYVQFNVKKASILERALVAPVPVN